MTAHLSDVEEAARLWAIRIQDPSFDEWTGFTEWLEREPAHLAAYEAVLDEQAWADELLAMVPQSAEALEEAPQPALHRRWLRWGGAAAAAVAAVGSWAVLDRNGAATVMTAPGEQRTIVLADGSRVLLNGGTSISFDADEPRYVEIAHGEALFEVKHDERNPFVVMAGETRLLDAGTVFNVVHDGGALEVAVAEGAVIYEPDKQAIRLKAGDALSRSGAGAAPVLGEASPQAVGSWQIGLLQYSDAPLERVASDLGRNIGRPVRAASGTKGMRFTGTLVMKGAPQEVLARAGPLLGVRFDTEGDAWKMTPTHGARP